MSSSGLPLRLVASMAVVNCTMKIVGGCLSHAGYFKCVSMHVSNAGCI